MTSLRDLQKRDTRRRLYETAIAMIRERGYEDVSVEEITSATGTAKGTFFNYYPTKDHVLAEYHERMTGWVMSHVEGRTFASCEEAIQTFVHRFADAGERDPKVLAIAVRRMFTSPIMFEADQVNSRRSIDWFERQIGEGVASGELKADLDRGTMVAMIAAVLSSTGNAWLLAGGFDAREAALRRMRFVFDAARSRGPGQ